MKKFDTFIIVLSFGIVACYAGNDGYSYISKRPQNIMKMYECASDSASSDSLVLREVTYIDSAIEYILDDVIKDLEEHGEKPERTGIRLSFRDYEEKKIVYVTGYPDFFHFFLKGVDDKDGAVYGYLYYKGFLVKFVNPIPYSSVSEGGFVEADEASKKKSFLLEEPFYCVFDPYEWRYRIKENISESNYTIYKIFKNY